MLGHSFLFAGSANMSLGWNRDVMTPDGIKIQSLDLVRETAAGSFDPSASLRATLAVIDLHALAPTTSDALINELFHERELVRRDGFAHARRKDSYSFGRLAAKLALRAHLPDHDPRVISIESGVFEQPILSCLDDAAVETFGVSISHSDRLAAALIFHRGHPMGIDVDLPSAADIDPVFDGLDAKTRVLCDELGLSKNDTASLLWVARESLAKTLTTGMMTPLDVYAASEINRHGDGFVLGYRNFAQYRTYVWPGVLGWLAITLPARTSFKNMGPDWS